MRLTRRALAVAIGGITAVSPAVWLAPAEAGTAGTSTTEPKVASSPAGTPLAGDGWFVLPADAACSAGTPAEPTTTIGLRDVVCVDVGDGKTVVDHDRFDQHTEPVPPPTTGAPTTTAPPLTTGVPVTDGGFARLVPNFSWDATTLPAVAASFTIVDGESRRKIDLSITPDIRIEIGFVPRTDSTIVASASPTVAAAAEAQSDPETETDPDTTPANGSGPEVHGEVDGEGEGPGVIVISRQRSVTKTISVVGADAGLTGLEIEEQVRPADLRLVVDGTVREADEGRDTVRLPLENSTLSYELGLALGANYGLVTTTQRTALVIGGVTVEDVVTDLALDAPLVEVDVQALAVVVGGEDTLVAVRVKNLRDEPVAGPLVLTLDAAAGGELIGRFSDLGGGLADDDQVSWAIPTGLDGAGEVVRSVVVDLNAGGAETQIEWRGTIGAQGAEASIASESVPSQIKGAGTDDGVGVDFTPGQLIRLIAFVMAFALVAVIFGAWTRRTRVEDDAESRHYELLRFQTYAETILVLVVLVAVLVLALRESLSGESAASLIGVIAGYAFGRGRQSLDGG